LNYIRSNRLLLFLAENFNC